MFPMMATVAELHDAKAIMAEEASSLGIAPMPRGIYGGSSRVGVMAEVFAEGLPNSNRTPNDDGLIFRRLLLSSKDRQTHDAAALSQAFY